MPDHGTPAGTGIKENYVCVRGIVSQDGVFRACKDIL